MQRIPIGLENSIEYRIPTANLVRYLFPGVEVFENKPLVMATGWLVGVCEWPAMEAIQEFLASDEWSLGIEVNIKHKKGIIPLNTLIATAICIDSHGRKSTWNVVVKNNGTIVAEAICKFIIVHKETYNRLLFDN